MTLFSQIRALAGAFMLGFLPGIALASPTDASDVVMRFAVLGDAEPKPLAEFPGLALAVTHINALAAEQAVDFVLGIGDIAHKGTVIQYDNASKELERLSLPFYPIMGNEEHHASVARFLLYANRWNTGKTHIANDRYVLEQDPVALVFASPDHGRDFDDSGVLWIAEQIDRLHPKPVFLMVHSAQVGAYPENAEKGITNSNFASLLGKENLAVIISGDLHMDMDRVDHSKKIGEVHYLHVPALERTKIPDETRHVPMFRMVSLYRYGEVVVDTYEAGAGNNPLERHAYRFSLRD